jgi:hypothetical protein
VHYPFPQPPQDRNPDRALVIRDVAVAQGGRVLDFDFANAPPVALFSVAGVTSVVSTFRTANGTTVPGFGSDVAGPSFLGALPAASQLRASDGFIEGVTFAQGATVSTFLVPQTSFEAPAPLGPVAASRTSAGFAQATWTAQPGALGYVWTAVQGVVRYEARLTLGWFPGEQRFVAPDLSKLGWPPSILLRPSEATLGSVTAITGTGELPFSAAFYIDETPRDVVYSKVSTSWTLP